MRPVLSARLRRAAGTIVVTTLFTGGLALIAAPQAAAATATVSPITAAYIDSVLPGTSLTPQQTGDMPVGAFHAADGNVHISKSYFTFDISAFRGATLSSAILFSNETAVTDCTTTLATQAWLTSTARKPTWNNQPTEQTELSGPNSAGGCPAFSMGWDALAALQDALSAGRTTVTIALRLPDDEQSDPRFGRRYTASPGITITYNHLPNKPAVQTVNGTACASTPIGIGPGTITLAADLTDPDNDRLTAQFVYWPVKQPDQRVELDSTAFPDSPPLPTRVSFDGQTNLEDGATYAWQVRGVDAQGPGPWSAVCRFSTDFTPPGSAPTVTSTDYPPGQMAGGTGIPGTFVFGARGVKDVVGYRYGFFGTPTTFVAASSKGGPATVQITPTSTGPITLTVVSVDGVGNQSPEFNYQIFVANNLPSVTCTPVDANVGTPRQCVFGPGPNTGAVSYTYTVGQSAPTTIAAGPDGTAAITVNPPLRFGSFTTVDVDTTVTLSNGVTTGAGGTTLFVEPANPFVTVTPDQPFVGQQVTFAFQPVQPNVVSYTYTLNHGAPVTIPAQPDGTATLQITPTASGFLDVDVFSTDDTGVQSGTSDQFVFVQSNQPNVTSTDYPNFEFAGGIGIPGTFTVTSPVPGVVSYTYVYGGAAPVTVPAGADGSASFVLTPTAADEQTVTVTGTFADGTTSDTATYNFFVNETAPAARAAHAQ